MFFVAFGCAGNLLKKSGDLCSIIKKTSEGGVKVLILGTLIVTWIAHNWWKLLLLLVAIIVIHEYVLYKNRKNKPADAADADAAGAGADTDAADASAEEAGADAAEEAGTENRRL